MTRLRAVVAVCLALPATARADGPSRRVLLQTTVGELVVSVNETAAPRAAAQFLELVRLGAYDGVPFARIVPGFAAQLAVLDARRPPLDAAQRAAIHPLPLEVAPGLRHHRGSLSLAHPAGRPDAGDASFAIFFADAPALDGKYTIFGQVVDGAATLDALARAITDEKGQPVDHVAILHARLLAPDELVTPKTDAEPHGTAALLALAAAMMLFGGAAFVLAGRVSPRMLASLGLLAVMVAFVPLFVVVLPYARGSRWLAAGLFAATYGFFKLMGRFEGPR